MHTGQQAVALEWQYLVLEGGRRGGGGGGALHGSPLNRISSTLFLMKTCPELLSVCFCISGFPPLALKPPSHPLH